MNIFLRRTPKWTNGLGQLFRSFSRDRPVRLCPEGIHRTVVRPRDFPVSQRFLTDSKMFTAVVSDPTETRGLLNPSHQSLTGARRLLFRKFLKDFS